MVQYNSNSMGSTQPDKKGTRDKKIFKFKDQHTIQSYPFKLYK